MFNQAKYNTAIDCLKQVVGGTRGWVSITEESRECGAPKRQIEIMARHLGLEITPSQGRRGMIARRPDVQKLEEVK